MAIVATSIGTIWYWSAVMAAEELLIAQEGHLRTAVQQISKEVLGYLQIASSSANEISGMYALAHQAAPQEGPLRYYVDFGASTWAMLTQEPVLASLLLAQARNPALVNPDDPTCDVDGVLISASYKALFTAGTSGTGFNSTPAGPSDAAKAGHVRMVNIQGALTLADPLAYKSTNFEKPCTGWLGGGEFLWSMQNLPGSWELRDAGVRAPVWLPGTVVVGKYPNEALRKKVFFDIPGPPWADASAFGALSIRISKSAISSSAGTLSIGEILREVCEQAGQTQRKSLLLFALTSEGELLASSLPELEVELREEGGDQPGRLLGLVRGDHQELVPQPLRGIASVLIERHCASATGGGLRCDWSSIQDLQHIGNHAVAASVVDDPLASGLGIVLLNVMELDALMDAAARLNGNLSLASGVVLAMAFLIALLLSRAILYPLWASRDNMLMLADMKVEEAIQRNGASKTPKFSALLTEVRDLRHSFIHAATCLKDWRDRELDRRVRLELKESSRKRSIVESAVQGCGKFSQPMALMSGGSFLELERLTPYETLRDARKLEFLDSEEALSEFQASNYIVFLSHEWLSWSFPDDARNTHLITMQQAVRNVVHKMSHHGDREVGSNRNPLDDVFVWVDYCCVPQKHRGMQMIAVPSLPKYVLSADIFVIVAPVADHETGRRCSLQSYGSRGWCRTEVMAKFCASGTHNLFAMCSEEGELEQVGEGWLTTLSVNVFGGEFSCCQRGHPAGMCDKEVLVEPFLMMYSLLLRQVRRGRSQAAESMLKHMQSNRDRSFPRTVTLAGAEGDEKQELFGTLAEETERFVWAMPWAECQRSLATSQVSADASRPFSLRAHVRRLSGTFSARKTPR